MISRFDTPGLVSGSNVIPGVESVIADFMLERIVDEESVIVILEEAFGADLDIFAEGSRSDRIRLDGTDHQYSHSRNHEGGHLPILISGRGKIFPYCLLNASRRSLVNSRCWS